MYTAPTPGLPHGHCKAHLRAQVTSACLMRCLAQARVKSSLGEEAQRIFLGALVQAGLRLARCRVPAISTTPIALACLARVRGSLVM